MAPLITKIILSLESIRIHSIFLLSFFLSCSVFHLFFWFGKGQNVWDLHGKPKAVPGQLAAILVDPPDSHRGSPEQEGSPNPGPERTLGKHADSLLISTLHPPCGLYSFCFTKEDRSITYHQ